MKLVIITQYLENYNTTGEGEPYWKPKGGSTYIVEDVERRDAVIRIAPTIIEFVASRNEMFQEYILSVDVVEDNTKVCEEWDHPTKFIETDDGWICKRFTSIDWVDGLVAKEETWIAEPNKERRENSWSEVYKLDTGEWVSNEEATRYRDEVKQKSA